jgi:hypothetical protein
MSAANEANKKSPDSHASAGTEVFWHFTRVSLARAVYRTNGARLQISQILPPLFRETQPLNRIVKVGPTGKMGHSKSKVAIDFQWDGKGPTPNGAQPFPVPLLFETYCRSNATKGFQASDLLGRLLGEAGNGSSKQQYQRN